MTKEAQDRRFIELWKGVVVDKMKKAPKIRLIEDPGYSAEIIVLDSREKFLLVEPGDKITSPTGVTSFNVTRVDGNELITNRNGKTGVRCFSELLPKKKENIKGYYTLSKRIKNKKYGLEQQNKKH